MAYISYVQQNIGGEGQVVSGHYDENNQYFQFKHSSKEVMPILSKFCLYYKIPQLLSRMEGIYG